MPTKHFLKLGIIVAAVSHSAAQSISVDVTPSHVKKTIIPKSVTGRGN